MGRVTVFTVTAGILLLFLVTCNASISVRRTAKQAKADSSCVSVKTKYGDTPVATCEAVSALQTSQDRLERSVESQQDQLQGLQGDVAALQGNDSVLRPVFFFIRQTVYPLCTVYTAFEAAEVARVAFGDENPNVHAVHVPCGDRCPRFQFSLTRNCYEPAGRRTGIDNSLFGCITFAFPFFGEPPCTHTVFMSNRGYTPNMSDLFNIDDMLLIDLFGLREGTALSSDVMAAMIRNLTAGDITPAAAMDGSLTGEGMTLEEATALRDELRALQSHSDP